MAFPSFTSPVANALVTSGWWDRRKYAGRDGYHEGLDFRAPIGTPVYAVADGTVVKAHNKADSISGKMISVAHPEGFVSQYMHLDGLLVSNGQRVSKGEQIAYSGNTANPVLSSAPHLHFALKLAADRLQEFVARFGKPSTGWAQSASAYGTGIPAEPLIPASYQPDVIADAAKHGVPLYRAGHGLGLMELALIGFVVWGSWKILR